MANELSFNAEKDLGKKEKEQFDFATLRIEELQKVRKNHYGIDLDKLWADADKDYIPHRLGGAGKKVLVENDETKGWRGTSSLVRLGEDNWQSDVSQANVFVKIQTALATLVDQNPTGVLTALTKKFQATTELIRQLYQRSWEYDRSKDQLKLFVFNLAKYGWATARTYPLRIERKVKVLVKYNPENPDESEYEEKVVVEFNDIHRENLDPRNVWMDDMARPNNPRSIKDWAWRKVYDVDLAEEEFGKYPLFAKAKLASGITTETISEINTENKQTTTASDRLMEVYFYENRIRDIFTVIINDVPVVIEPLPISTAKGIKKLSLWQTHWMLRHGESPYGVGLYEAVRYDQSILDRFRNMTIDQLTLSIYKMFFYQGTQNLQDTGQIRIQPGVGKQVLDPKNINWLNIPGPGRDAFEGIKMLKEDVDEVSGITAPLMGEITGKTAFEIAQAKESALKRLKNPLNNILEALNEEGYITIALVQLLYSIPETYEISDPVLIDAYLQETKGDAELYERDNFQDEEGVEQSTFTAKVYPEFPLNLDTDEAENLIETEDTKFFRVKPKFLEWDGIINVKAQSILTPSKQVDKALDLEMYNMLIPLMQGMAQERAMFQQQQIPNNVYALTNGKTAISIVKLYDKDPKDIIPDDWFKDTQMPQTMEPLFVGGQGVPAQGQPQGNQSAETLVGSTQAPANPQSFIGRIAQKVTAPFRI